VALKENLRKKIRLDRLARKLAATIGEKAGQRYLNKPLMQEFLESTDRRHLKIRDLDLYVRPSEGEVEEVVVLDNELPIYHTTVADVALRKSPVWKEMLSLGNLKKILNDQDVIVSKGRASLIHLHNTSLAGLDLSYTRKDIDALVDEARLALEQQSLDRICESLDFFFELLGFQALNLGVLDENIHAFAKPRADREEVESFIHLILFDDKNLNIWLIKGDFSPDSDWFLARALLCVHGKEPADLQGAEVFEFLAALTLEKQSVQ
jgi:hypothetical protein